MSASATDREYAENYVFIVLIEERESYIDPSTHPHILYYKTLIAYCCRERYHTPTKLRQHWLRARTTPY